MPRRVENSSRAEGWWFYKREFLPVRVRVRPRLRVRVRVRVRLRVLQSVIFLL